MRSRAAVAEVVSLETFDIETVRADFPMLDRRIDDKLLVYLDNAATSLKPRPVLEALDRYYRQYTANVHRGIYRVSEEATEAYESARRKVARFINARSPREVVFVRNATEAVNLVAYAWGRAHVGEGDEIVLTEMEHHSNLVPWQQLAREKAATLLYARVDDNGRLDGEHLDSLLSDRTRLLAISGMSNVLGTVPDLRKIIATAHARGIPVLVDGAQAVSHLPVDVRAWDCDFLAISGHKMLGPTGIGALYAKREILEGMDPFLAGGEMIIEVTKEGARWNEIPWKFEAGTPAVAQAIGLGAAVDYLSGIGMQTVRHQEELLTTYAMDRLSQVEGLRILGPPAEERGGVVAFTLGDVHPHDIATILDREGIAIRAGHHCAMPLHQRYGLAATARASFYLYNTREEVDRLVTALEAAQEIFAL